MKNKLVQCSLKEQKGCDGKHDNDVEICKGCCEKEKEHSSPCHSGCDKMQGTANAPQIHFDIKTDFSI